MNCKSSLPNQEEQRHETVSPVNEKLLVGEILKFDIIYIPDDMKALGGNKKQNENIV